MLIQKIYIGGWFQRTTLHLTEVWDFLKHQKSELGFSSTELQKALVLLRLDSVERKSDLLEYIDATTQAGVNFRIYEDGLMVLEKNYTNLKADFREIKEYYDTKLSRSLSLLFSKGAPVPKELANIKTILPYIVMVSGASVTDLKKLFKDAKQEIYSTVSSGKIDVYRSPGLIIINNLEDEKLARQIIESQIFFREFKTQLHRYLNIHRSIWEKIAHIKEQGSILGKDIDIFRNQLSEYQKTINLIDARINQMDVYIKTRQKVSDIQNIDAYLHPLFQYKFETLLDTHAYIKHLWRMTQEYLNSAIATFTELQARSTKNTISSLQLVTTIGVVAGIIGYLAKDTLPKLTVVGLAYFVLLMALTWIINSIISKFYRNRKYTLETPKVLKDL